jgi:DNA excision repair protein ERCC-5
MGVKGLWPILHDCARPTPLPSLNRKRLAVDASIWIYQFLKAVRDKEGNALRNSHIVGFFRRICKLLYFGIKPVFVFDGVAPALKKQTIQKRKQRREGRRDDATRTAARLLAVHMQRRGEEEVANRKKAKAREKEGLQPFVEDEEALKEGEEIIYADEMGMSAQQRSQTRKFRKTDAYHLPELDGGIEEMRRPDDARFSGLGEMEGLEEYARQNYNGEELKHFDFDSIDWNGDLFKSLPTVEQYSLRNAARLKSRQRTGISKEELDEMYPDRMDFSKRQVERAIDRNSHTQALMKMAGMDIADMDQFTPQRIAGSTNREYTLVKTEYGYGLGGAIIDKSAGDRNKPIDVDDLHRKVDTYQKSESEDEFEDVPVVGLNRLPRHWKSGAPAPILGQLDARNQSEPADTLFVDGADADNEHNNLLDEENDELSRAIALSLDNGLAEEDLSEMEHVNRAIALSLENNHMNESDADEDDDFEDVPLPEYEQVAVQAIKPFASSSKSQVAHIINNRANAAVPIRKIVAIDEESDSDDMDLQASLARARRRKAPQARPPQPKPIMQNKSKAFNESPTSEKMDFKSSIFGSNAEANPATEHVDTGDVETDDQEAGGFEKESLPESKPLPPWLAGSTDIRFDVNEQQKRGQQIDAEDKERADQEERTLQMNNAPIEIESSDGEDDDVEIVDPPTVSDNYDTVGHLRMFVEETGAARSVIESNISDSKQVTPEKTARAASFISAQIGDDEEEAVDWSESDHGAAIAKPNTASNTTPSAISISPQLELDEVTIDKPQPLGMPSRQVNDVDVEDEEMGAAPRPEAPAEYALPIADEFENVAEDHDSDSFDEFSDPDDEALLAQLAVEAETHEQFANSLNSKTLGERQADYEQELKALRNQQKKDRRDADEVTSVMSQECQQLLKFFGLPYIIAPGEAEAQCAELVHLELVDGVVTDDCDIFLFGGTRVYKNLFNSNKDVECYLQSDIEKELSLGRDQLIALAQLLGSDYAEGLHGVGSVTAIELISEFSTPNTGLQEFKDWWTSVQNLHPPPLSEEPSTFRKKFRRAQAAKLFLPAGFPSSAVNEAYLKPLVDKTKEDFVWGVPDLDGLRDFLMKQIGWTQERVDDVLVPVIKDMNQRELEGTQSNITRYFQGTVGAGAKTAAQEAREGGSKRMKDAVNKLKGKKKASLTLEERGTFADIGKKWAMKNPAGKEDKPKKVSKVAKKKRPAALAEEDEEGIGGDGAVENSAGQHTGTDNDAEAEADDESGSHNEDDYREPSVAAGKRKQKPKIPARQPKRKKVKT